jgi:urease accessory protein
MRMAATRTTAITTTDTDAHALLRLLTWLSPAFPVGSFAYSGGLERAVHDQLVRDAGDVETWIATMLVSGTWWNDAVLLAEAWSARDDAARLASVADLAESLAGSAERHQETILQGRAFVAAASAWPHPVLPLLGDRPAYAVAVGAVAGAHGITLHQTLTAFLHALAAQAISAAIRLGTLGQQQGLTVLAGLEATVLATADRATGSTLDDLGGATVMADIAAMRHETQYSRLFRS